MSDKERDSAARRKRAADPNQPQKSGAAKPTNVSTDPKKKMKESFVTNLSKASKIKSLTPKPVATPGTTFASGGKFPKGTFDNVSPSAGAPARISSNRSPVGAGGVDLKKGAFQGGGSSSSKPKVDKYTGDRTTVKDYIKQQKRYGTEYSEVRPDAKFGDAKMTVKGRDMTKSQYSDIKKQKLPEPKLREERINEAKDKKGKGSGTKDACYHKVKSRYSVWPLSLIHI